MKIENTKWRPKNENRKYENTSRIRKTNSENRKIRKTKNENIRNRKIRNEIGTTFGVQKSETNFGVPKSETTFGVPKIKKMENRCSWERERERDLPSSSGGCEDLLLQEVARLQSRESGREKKKEWGREKRREKAIV